MSSRIVEYYGWAPLAPESVENAQHHRCPFVADKCIKLKSKALGACSLQVGDSDPVIICPNRLYAQNFQALRDIAARVFSLDPDLVSATENEKRRRSNNLNGREIVVFGKYFGGELGIPTPPGLEEGESAGSFYIDFILARVDDAGNLLNFAAVEVQTIDTTDSYADAAAAYRNGERFGEGNNEGLTKAGLNWENVSKRILPQLIYKGHALRREPLCSKGLFFVLPHAVYQRIKRRVGGNLLAYPLAAGTITFITYDLGAAVPGDQRELVYREEFTTTVEQIAFAFVSPRNLPDAGVYEAVIGSTVEKLTRKRAL
jgi:hypothetical protein